MINFIRSIKEVRYLKYSSCYDNKDGRVLFEDAKNVALRYSIIFFIISLIVYLSHYLTVDNLPVQLGGILRWFDTVFITISGFISVFCMYVFFYGNGHNMVFLYFGWMFPIAFILFGAQFGFVPTFIVLVCAIFILFMIMGIHNWAMKPSKE